MDRPNGWTDELTEGQKAALAGLSRGQVLAALEKEWETSLKMGYSFMPIHEWVIAHGMPRAPTSKPYAKKRVR